jgi:hypothetical protein
MLEQLMNSPDELAACKNAAAKIRQKRRRRLILLTGHANAVDHVREQAAEVSRQSVDQKREERRSLEHVKQQQAQVAHSVREEEELRRKFLVSHKWQIKRLHVNSACNR